MVELAEECQVWIQTAGRRHGCEGASADARQVELARWLTGSRLITSSRGFHITEKVAACIVVSLEREKGTLSGALITGSTPTGHGAASR